MNQSIIHFYLLANKLKGVIRTGWKEVNISCERLESVAEHVYGCLVLAIAIDSENKLELDMAKVFKMLVVKELEKVYLDKDYNSDGTSNVDRREKARTTILEVIDGLIKQEELVSLFEEVYEKASKEAIFACNVSKIESDLQAKIYDLKGEFSLENALADIKNYGDKLAEEILPQVKNASDGWILFDRRYYAGNALFESLSKDIQNLDSLDD